VAERPRRQAARLAGKWSLSHSVQALDRSHLADLHELARARGVPRFRTLRRQELIEAIRAAGPEEEHRPESGLSSPSAEVEETDIEARDEHPLEHRVGVLDVVPDGYGFMRVEGLARSAGDVFVSRSQVRALGLRSGDEIAGTVRPPRRSDRYPSLAEIDAVNAHPPDEQAGEPPEFARLTPTQPRERLALPLGSGDYALRMVELVAPLARGHRYLIASPPTAGATTLSRELAQALSNDPALASIVLLVDARPEEIAAWQQSGIAVHATDSERSAEAHVRLAELALERAKRLAEQGLDVVLLIDSLTRLARAYRLLRPRSGRGGRSEQRPDDDQGMEPTAVRSAKRWFAAARDTEEKGSLTIVATVRVDSDSPFEQLVVDSLGDAANAQLRLDAQLASAGLFPALDVTRSRLHGEEAILGGEEAETLRRLRQDLFDRTPAEAWEALRARAGG
jgi:transcription termination factor Rho